MKKHVRQKEHWKMPLSCGRGSGEVLQPYESQFF